MKILVSLVFFVTAYVSQGQISPNASSINNKNWEVWQERIPVSGGVRVGLMLEQSKSEIKPNRFFVMIPDTALKSLCVELSSKDGRYSARVDYDLTGVEQGMKEFYLPTRYAKELKKYASDELVILASLSSSCGENPEWYLISSWDDKIYETASVVAYVNSAVSTSLSFQNGNGDNKELKFENLKIPTVAFNKKCIVPINLLGTESLLQVRQRVRKMNRVRFNTYEIPVKRF